MFSSGNRKTSRKNGSLRSIEGRGCEKLEETGDVSQIAPYTMQPEE
jgi:hypothetical protein